MTLTITCQTCGKILASVSKDQITNDDVTMYEANSSCDTVQGQGVDGDGNPITLYDGQSSIQATKTV